MHTPIHRDHQCYGMTTLGEKGQVVIPADARKSLKLNRGDKLVVFSMGHDMVILSKAAALEEFAKHLSKKLESLQKALATASSSSL